MKKVLCTMLPILAIALVIAAVSGAAFAQGEDVGEYFTTNYFSNNTASGAPDATLRYTEHYGAVLRNNALCANIYVFDADQQPTECCSCQITANGLVTTSVRTQLTANPLTGMRSNNGVVQIISSTVPPTGCDATFGATFTGASFTLPTAPPSPEVDSWMTHIQKVGTGITATYPITETEGVEEELTTGELDDLAVDCAFLQEFGSGKGVCSCGAEL